MIEVHKYYQHCYDDLFPLTALERKSIDVSSDSQHYQHLSNKQNRKIDQDLQDKFHHAFCLKHCGFFKESFDIFQEILKKNCGHMEMIAECYFQSGEIVQYLNFNNESLWVEYFVACLTFCENHFGALSGLRLASLQEKKPNIVNKKCSSRVLLVLGSNAATVSFANKVIKDMSVVGIIQQYAEFPVIDISNTPNENELPLGVRMHKHNIDYFKSEEVLGNCWNAIYTDQPVKNKYVARGDINDNSVINWVKELNVDLIISHGPELLKSTFIKSAGRYGINVHWGLSPMYRGMDTVRWPLYENKPEWIGVTIHLLGEKLDAGPIICQDRPELIPGHNFRMIEYSLTNIASNIISSLANNLLLNKLICVEQPKNIGRQYWAKEWTPDKEKYISVKYIANIIREYQKNKEYRDRNVTLINPCVRIYDDKQ